MADIDFMELAIYCQNKYKEERITKEDYYIKTLFVAITKEGNAITSATPHILKMAEQCILLHISKHSTSTGLWQRETFQFINKNGVVHDHILENNFKFYLRYPDSLGLAYDNNGAFTSLSIHPGPLENSFEKVWKLYSRVKDLDSFAKIQLVAELFQKDEKILELEKQMKKAAKEFDFEKAAELRDIIMEIRAEMH